MRNHATAIIAFATLTFISSATIAGGNGGGNRPPDPAELVSNPCIEFALKLFQEADEPFSQSSFNTISALIDDNFASADAAVRHSCAAKALQALAKSETCHTESNCS